MNFPTIKTQRLVLNELTENDTDSIYKLFSDDKVVEFYDLDVFSSSTQASDLIAFLVKRFTEQQGIRWAIRLDTNGKLIGTCGFNSWMPKMQTAVIGYDLMKGFWGQGFAAEAVEAILQEGFKGGLPCGKLNRVQADTVKGNIASEKLLKKLGFVEEGVRRQAGYWKGQYHDLKCYGLIRTDFSGANSR
ncbi:MAG: GNAT family N-acetyltransferase [Gammaproteobacteria bacterium]|nr:GNAT family N-acetyltransferase [Gammaproteobacteria bacterium]